jgi:aspartate carbamoyltransferase catalytic subunit
MVRHVLTAEQFKDRELLGQLFSRADYFQEIDQLPQNDKIRKKARKEIRQILDDQIVATLFYEPSTRTHSSFKAAASKLGANLDSSDNAGQFSSAAKGETIEDTIKTIGSYVNIIVLRHPEIGSAARAAAVSRVPIINAGDGAGEHPTQALLDLYTIQREIGTFDNKKIALVGDLLNGRTIHSLTQLLEVAKKPELFLVAPEPLKLPEKYRKLLQAKNIKFRETDSLAEVLPHADVVYMTRIQKERFGTDLELYEQVKDSFILGPEEVNKMQKAAILMHPLPRLNEISPEVDNLPQARYFKQVQNGLYLRMSLLEHVSQNSPT